MSVTTEIFECVKCGGTKSYQHFSKTSTGAGWFDPTGTRRHRICLYCDRARAIENNRLKARTAERLGLGRGLGQGSKWVKVPREERRRQLALQREIEAREGFKPGDVIVPEAPEVTTDPDLLRIQAEDASVFREADKNYDRFADGFVYVVSNPTWPGWFKVGSARNYAKRFNSFQTSDPFRAYVREHTQYFTDRRKAERMVHHHLETFYPRRNEWFQAPLDFIERVIDDIKARHDNADIRPGGDGAGVDEPAVDTVAD